MTIAELKSLTPSVAAEMSDAEIIKAGKAAQKFVNQRLNRLEKAGIRTAVTSGGASKSSLTKINTRAKAEKAILQAVETERNPLGTPGKIHKMMKESGLQKNPRTGKWTIKQTKQWLKDQTPKIDIPSGDNYNDDYNDEWTEEEILAGDDEFFEWARANHPEWNSKQTKALYKIATEEYHVDPIKFWSADYSFRKKYYDAYKEYEQDDYEDSTKMSSDDLLKNDYFSDVEDEDGIDWDTIKRR